jgi:DNA-binding LacI/PurR family transcriptional regulator
VAKLRDIAERAGTAMGTVSLVVRESCGGGR